MKIFYFFSLTILALRCRAGLFTTDVGNWTDLVEGDMLFSKRPDSVAARGAICEGCGRWLKNSDGTYHVPYEFGAGTTYSAADVRKFEWAFRYVASVSNLKYVKRSTEPDYISIIQSDTVCFSYVGREGDMQYLGIGRGCETVMVINHEFGHALGLGHEQCRPDAEDYVILHWENVQTGVESNFRTNSMYLTAAQFSEYDLASVMHYPSYTFSKGGGLRTISAKDPSKSWILDGRRSEYSICDITEINLMYPGTKKPPKCVPDQLPSGFEPTEAYKSDASAIDRCRKSNEWIITIDGGHMCQVVGGGDLPPIPEGILTDDTTTEPTTTEPTTATETATTTTGAPDDTTTKTALRKCHKI